MGVVVTLFMLLGLLVIAPLRNPVCTGLRRNKAILIFVVWGLLLTGLWNVLWFGLRYPTQFWGVAAIISGVAMIFIALLISVSQKTVGLSQYTWVQRIVRAIKPAQVLIIAVLFLCFVLYAVTLIQLNLGYPIIG